jgi:multidrug resistance efflux pump
VLGLGLLGLGAWTVVPGLIHPISTEAMVNADVVMLRAPVDGQLTGSPPTVGDPVEAGLPLARVHAFRPDSGRRDQLTLDLAAQRRLAAALAEEAREMAALERDLTRRGAAFRSAAVRRLDLAGAEARAKRAAAQAGVERARAELNRKNTLLTKDIVAPVAVEMARAAERDAAAGLAAAAAAAARAEVELGAARQGVFVGDGGSDVPYALQRRDELRLRRAGRRVEAAEVGARVAELERQLAVEEILVARLSEAALWAPVTGVVWQRFAAAGDGVRMGDPVLGLVDCRSLFLTAVLPKRFFAELKAGDRARARLPGVEGTLPAMVQSVRAAGGGQASSTLAVTPAAIEGRDVVVVLAVFDRQLGSRTDNLCQVGQRVSVTFEMPALQPYIAAIATRAAGMVRRRGAV